MVPSKRCNWLNNVRPPTCSKAKHTAMAVATTSVARASPHDRDTRLSPEATLEAVLSPSLGGPFSTFSTSAQHQIELIGSVARLYLKSDGQRNVTLHRGEIGSLFVEEAVHDPLTCPHQVLRDTLGTCCSAL